MSENTTANQPQVIGQLSEEEMGQITSLKEVASRHLSEIGQLELRKNRLVMTLERNEQQAQTILAGARDRLNIPADAPWQVQEDGNVLAILTDSPDQSGDEGSN